jgi:hypothetical protein
MEIIRIVFMHATRARDQKQNKIHNRKLPTRSHTCEKFTTIRKEMSLGLLIV